MDANIPPNQTNSSCTSKCCGCIEIRVGVILIALFGIGWGCYEFSIHLNPDSYEWNEYFVILEILAGCLLIGSIAALYGVYKNNIRIIFCFIIVCGLWTGAWVFITILTLNLWTIWQIPLWIYNTYIVRKYYYIKKNETEQQPLILAHNAMYNQQQQYQQDLIYPMQPIHQIQPHQQIQPIQPIAIQPMSAMQPIPHFVDMQPLNNDVWSCPKCTFDESKLNISCQICGAVNPNNHNNDNNNVWRCPLCTYEQPQCNNKCPMCDTNNPNGMRREQRHDGLETDYL